MSRRSSSLRQLAATGPGRVTLGLFGGTMVGVLTVLAGQTSGFLPPGEPRLLRDPCQVVPVARLVPGGDRRTGGGGRLSAECKVRALPSRAPHHAELEIKVEKTWNSDRARERHRRGCASLAGLGAVRRPSGLGDEACAATDAGTTPSCTVLVRRGRVRIMVRYTSQGKDAASVERDALHAAHRVAASL